MDYFHKNIFINVNNNNYKNKNNKNFFFFFNTIIIRKIIDVIYEKYIYRRDYFLNYC